MCDPPGGLAVQNRKHAGGLAEVAFRRVPLLARQQCEAGTRTPLPDKTVAPSSATVSSTSFYPLLVKVSEVASLEATFS